MRNDAVINESDAAMKLHFDRQEKSRILFSQADCSHRLKDAEGARIQLYHDTIYRIGEEIFFLDEDDLWNGPAVVLGTESKTVLVSSDGQVEKVAVARVRARHCILNTDEDTDYSDPGSEMTDDMDTDDEYE